MYFDIRNNARKGFGTKKLPSVTTQNYSHCCENPLSQFLSIDWYLIESTGSGHEIFKKTKLIFDEVYAIFP